MGFRSGGIFWKEEVGPDGADELARHDRIDAPWFLEGPIDGESFRIYVENVLVPTLRPGDIVIIDNLGSHKGKLCVLRWRRVARKWG
jgi:hypothetical protein